MKKMLAATIQSLTHQFKGDTERPKKYPPDFSQQNLEIYNSVKAYTSTSLERANALINAVNYLVANKIDGAFVECGVWKGGSIMAMALTLKKLGDESRELYLYDTFSGMSAPSDVDISVNGEKAADQFSQTKLSADSSNWCFSSLEEVKENVLSTGYPQEKIYFIEGKVEDTIPTNIPQEIALLRLDTDWYESTKHEMTHLFPLLKPNGVLIIDDYGHWEGARKAIDEYIADNNICILLNRIDYTGRIAVKTVNNKPT
ncbi:MAG: TylF/MycF/NovP-related O-methyltransferase [Cyanophyceae cyanobacterium]